MKLRGVVIQDEAGSLLKMLRLKFHARRGSETMGLLTTGHKRLLKLAAEGLAAKEAQEAGAFSKGPEPLGIRRAKPLEVDRQLR